MKRKTSAQHPPRAFALEVEILAEQHFLYGLAIKNI